MGMMRTSALAVATLALVACGGPAAMDGIHDSRGDDDSAAGDTPGRMHDVRDRC